MLFQKYSIRIRKDGVLDLPQVVLAGTTAEEVVKRAGAGCLGASASGTREDDLRLAPY